MYKYDVPVGHIEGREFFRHRVDEDTILAQFELWLAKTQEKTEKVEE